MGCKLPKPHCSDDAPGKIYSTLRKAQVETRTDVVYTYHFLDFLLGKEEVAVSSLLCLSSVRELPVQVCEFYQQGFLLAAVHPFVHSSGPAGASLQRQLHRAILIREGHRCSENGLLKCVGPRLETDVCFSGCQVPDPEVIQGYVEKVQDLADSGILFTGFLQQPGGGVSFLGHWDPGEFSLPSSPSPIHQHTSHPVFSHRQERPHQGPRLNHYSNQDHLQDCPVSTTHRDDQGRDHVSCQCRFHHAGITAQRGHHQRIGGCERQTRVSAHRGTGDDGRSLDLDEETRPMQASCDGLRMKRAEQIVDEPRERTETSYFLNRVQVFALYNHAVMLSGSPRFYSLRIPLRVHKEAGLITTVSAHWLDHMTQHFRSGAQLIDGYFHLSDDTESSSTMESVFIFQSASDDILTPTYDAIVVEQWTVIDGVAVKTDYIPLLQALAPYGWRLMCVLPTPVVKTNSDGSLATKQILFLQRPMLPRKRTDFTRLNFKGRNKRNFNGKNPVRKEILSPAPPSAEQDLEGRACGTTSGRETSSRNRRNSAAGRTPAVTQHRSVTQEHKGPGQSAHTNQHAKEVYESRVSQAAAVQSPEMPSRV